MATKKELVEAHAFSRRRLVTAFLSGAPGGREVEPVRPARSLVGGIALAVLLCAGAAVAGFLGGRPNSDWTQAGSFVISKDTGEQYVVLRGGGDPVIQRVPNFVSAQLLLGTSAPSVYTVRDEHIRTIRLGEDLGIEGAPAGLPSPEELIRDGWTACTADEAGVQVSLGGGAAAEVAPGSAIVVRTRQGDSWLVAADETGPAYRFALPKGRIARSGLLDALRLGTVEAAPVVAQDWLNLFPAGPALNRDNFGVGRPGDPVDYQRSQTDLGGYQIGQLLSDGDGHLLLGDDGPQRLDEFAGTLYEALTGPAEPISSRVQAEFTPPTHPAEWPATLPAVMPGVELCAVLGDVDGTGQVALGGNPTPEASGRDVDPGQHVVRVDPAGGAYVLAGGGSPGAGGTPYVIDAKGMKYALIGPEADDHVGYGGVDPFTIPAAWLEYFEGDVFLSVNAARRVAEDAPEPDEGE